MTAWMLTAILSLASVDVEVTGLDGTTLVGELVDLQTDQLSVRTAEDNVSTMSLQNVVALATNNSSTSESHAQAWLNLMDGSRLAVSQFNLKQTQADATLTWGEHIHFDRRSLFSIRWLEDSESTNNDKPWSEPTLARWNELKDEEITADRIVIRRDSTERPGEFTLRTLKGVIHGVDTSLVDFEFRGRRMDVNRIQKVAGLFFYQPPREQEITSLCQLHCTTGSVLKVHQLMHSDGTNLRVKTVSQTIVQIPWTAVRRIDFSSDKIVQLSDMEPESVEWTPLISGGRSQELLARLYRPRRDQGFDSQPLRLNIAGKEREFTKGIALHSRTEMVFRLSERYRRLQAIAGIDPELRLSGHVQLVILGDDRLLFESEVHSEMEPMTLDMSISGVRRLKIIVDYGDNLDVADHLFLCDCKVTK